MIPCECTAYAWNGQMPEYLKEYKPGDVVPDRVFQQACLTCSPYLQGGPIPYTSSDAGFFGLKRKGDTRVNDIPFPDLIGAEKKSAAHHLRREYAKAALMGMLAAGPRAYRDGNPYPEKEIAYMARTAFDFAEAMLLEGAERKLNG